MFMFIHLIVWIVVGFIVGLIARAIYPGAQSLNFLTTTIIGILGSVVGGLVARLLFKPSPGAKLHAPGLILSVLGALLVLYCYLHFGSKP